MRECAAKIQTKKLCDEVWTLTSIVVKKTEKSKKKKKYLDNKTNDIRVVPIHNIVKFRALSGQWENFSRYHPHHSQNHNWSQILMSSVSHNRKLWSSDLIPWKSCIETDVKNKFRRTVTHGFGALPLVKKPNYIIFLLPLLRIRHAVITQFIVKVITTKGKPKNKWKIIKFLPSDILKRSRKLQRCNVNEKYKTRNIEDERAKLRMNYELLKETVIKKNSIV